VRRARSLRWWGWSVGVLGDEWRWFCGAELWEKVAFMGVFFGGKYNLLIRGKAGNRESLASSAVRRQTQTQ